MIRFSIAFAGLVLMGFQNTVQAGTIKVVDIKVARDAWVDVTVGARPVYVQNGAALRPDKIDYDKPYCFTSGVHFRLDDAKTYHDR